MKLNYNCGIYKWTNKINGKIYIGQSVNLKNRRRSFYAFNQYVYGGDLINKARKKYNSTDYWSYEVLEYCTPDELNDKEIYYINSYDSTDRNIGYNLTIGGDGICGYQKTEKQIRLQSEAISQTVLQLDKETNEVIKEWKNAKEAEIFYTGKKTGTIYNVCKGKKVTAFGFKWEYKDKPELARHNYKGNKKLKETLYKPIYQLDYDTEEIIKEWEGIVIAAKALNINAGCISGVCNGNYISSGGYKWCFKENYGKINIRKKYIGKAVYRINIETNEIIDIFPSAKEAANKLNLSSTSTISKVCNGKRKQAFGYKWQYVE